MWKEKSCPQCGGFLDTPSGRGRTEGDPTAHFTVVFNAFVFMQLFNWINCRKIFHEWNVLEGIQNNKTFCTIWLVCVLIQVFIVVVLDIGQSGLELQCNSHNLAFRTTHISGTHWVICLVCGLGSMPWQLFLIFLAKTFFPGQVKTDALSMAGGFHTSETSLVPEDKYTKGVAPVQDKLNEFWDGGTG